MCYVLMLVLALVQPVYERYKVNMAEMRQKISLSYVQLLWNCKRGAGITLSYNKNPTNF